MQRKRTASDVCGSYVFILTLLEVLGKTHMSVHDNNHGKEIKFSISNASVTSASSQIHFLCCVANAATTPKLIITYISFCEVNIQACFSLLCNIFGLVHLKGCRRSDFLLACLNELKHVCLLFLFNNFH